MTADDACTRTKVAGTLQLEFENFMKCLTPLNIHIRPFLPDLHMAALSPAQ